jgi:hypothetical protein
MMLDRGSGTLVDVAIVSAQGCGASWSTVRLGRVLARWPAKGQAQIEVKPTLPSASD